MKRAMMVALAAAGLCCAVRADPLDDGFAKPPDSAKPQTWWHWIDGRINKDCITAELEAIKQIGVGGVQVFMAGKGKTPENETPCLSAKWKDAVRHAVSECDRLGLEFTAQNSPGWSGAGGPWITPDHAMFLVESQEKQVAGGQTVSLTAAPTWPEKGDTFYRDIAILAFPTPPAIREAKPLPIPVVTASFPSEKLELLNRKEVSRDLYRKDKEADRVAVEAKEPRTDWIQFAFPEAVMVRNITLASMAGCIEPDAQKPLVTASMDGIDFTPVVQLTTYAAVYNCELDDVAHAVPATTAKFFRLVWPDLHRVCLTRVEFFSRPVLSGLKGKTGQSGRTFVDEPVLPEEPGTCIEPKTLIDLTGRKDAKGDLVWTAPEGEWTVLRIGYRNKRRCNMPAPQEGSGLECDKFDPAVASFHFDQYMGLILKEAKATGSKAVKGILLDSWEAETQNWTHTFSEEFKKRRGYDVLPWLPAYAGYIVQNRDLTQRYLRDARQTCNDLLMENFFDVLRRRAHENGLNFIAESVGGSGAGTMVADAVEHYLHVDVPMTEAGRPMQEAVSAAHLTGHPLVAMEAHTSRAMWETSPRMLKSDEDFFFSVGINRIVFHTYAHNPDPEKLYPGPAFWSYGTPFSRGQTWWSMGKDWITYLARCQFLLQKGQAVADVLACYGEETLGPLVKVYKKAGGYSNALAGLPQGYTYDLLPACFLIHTLDVRPDGRLSGPDGSAYRLIALYDSDRVTPELLRKLKVLVAKGATVLGPKPTASISLSNYPACDAEIQAIANELWGTCDGTRTKEHAYGKGRILCGMTLEEALNRLSIPPDVQCRTRDAGTSVSSIHRRENNADIYFINRTRGAVHPETDTLGFRVTGKVPEIWNPLTGEKIIAKAYTQENGVTWIPFEEPLSRSTWFIVFRTPTNQAQGTSTQNFKSFDPLHELTGPWSLAFKGVVAPGNRELPKLTDLSKSDQEEIKYFSGVITYTKSFNWDKPVSGDLKLSLGTVSTTAEVYLNGKFCGTVWTPPYEVAVSGALNPGKNELEIRVANTWANRLIGDQRLPENQRKTWTTFCDYTKDTDVAKYPSGLMGPVTLQAANQLNSSDVH